MNDFPSTTEKYGWQQWLIRYQLQELSGKNFQGIREDERSADWVYLLQCKPGQKALVIGPGLGAVPFRLATLGLCVYTLDYAQKHSQFIRIVSRERKIETIYPTVINGCSEIPFSKARFDLVVMRNYSISDMSLKFNTIVNKVQELLKPGGQAVVFVNNKWSPLGLFIKSNAAHFKSESFHGYQKALRAAGFSSVEMFAPFPSVWGIPLFVLPLSRNHILSFFLKTLFPLFATVSPEVKKQYGIVYDAANIAAYLILKIHCAWIIRWLCPGYILLARTRQEKSHA